MRLLLIDQPIRNRGDESAHKALVRSLLSALPGVEITVPYRYPEADMAPFMVPGVRYIRTEEDLFYYRCRLYGAKYGLRFLWDLDPAIRRLAALYREADAVVGAPGGINLGGFKDWHHLFLLQLALRERKPLLYFGRSIGPFPETDPDRVRFRREAGKVLDGMRFISLRDAESARYIGGRPYVETLDSAFLERPEAEIPAEVRAYTAGRPYFVFVPNSLVWHYRYRDLPLETVRGFFSDMLAALRAAHPSCGVVMLPQLYNGPLWIENDRLFFEHVAQEGVFVAPDTYGSDVQQAIVRGAEFLVGARYHSVVFAVNNDVPFVALSYEHKMSGLAEALGLSDCVVDITEAVRTPEGRSAALGQVLAAPLSASPEAGRHAAAVARAGFDAFLKALKEVRP